MPLPSYTAIAATPEFKDLDAGKKAELTEKYWSQYEAEQRAETPRKKLFPTSHPMVTNEDGSVSNVILSGEDVMDADGNFSHTVAFPTMVEGKKLTKEQAFEVAKKNGLENYPRFDTAAELNQWAEANHDKINENGELQDDLDRFVERQRKNSAGYIDARERRDNAAPIAKRFAERDVEDSAFALRLTESQREGRITPEQAQAELDGYVASTAERDSKLEKTKSLFDPKVAEQMAPAFQSMRDLALRGGQFGSAALDARASDILPGGEKDAVVGSQKAYAALRKQMATDFHLSEDEVDDVVKHQLDLQPEKVSRDAFGTPHIKSEVLAQGAEATAAAINESDIPWKSKQDLLKDLPSKIEKFQKGTVAGVRKNSPGLARMAGLGDEGTPEDFQKITKLLNDTRTEQFTGGFAASLGSTLRVVDPFKFTVPEVGDQYREALKQDVQGLEALNQLSAEFNKSKTEIFGTDAAAYGSGAESVVEAVGLGVLTAGAGNVFAPARMASMGKSGQILAGGLNRAVAIAPIAALGAGKSAMGTYDSAIAAGMNDDEASKLAWKSGLIEFGVTSAMSTVGLGGTEAVGAQLARPVVRNAVREGAKKAFSSFGGRLFKGVTEEEIEENMITALDSVMVQAKINPEMTGDDFAKALRDTAAVTLAVSGPTVALGAFSETREKPTYEQTTEQLGVTADLTLADAVDVDPVAAAAVSAPVVGGPVEEALGGKPPVEAPAVGEVGPPVENLPVERSPQGSQMTTEELVARGQAFIDEREAARVEGVPPTEITPPTNELPPTDAPVQESGNPVPAPVVEVGAEPKTGDATDVPRSEVVEAEVPSGEVAPARKLKDFEVRESPDDVSEVGSANDLTASEETTEVPVSELVGGVDLTQPNERARVDRLKEQILSEKGYVGRLIVDGKNQVVEGQHRLEALRELGFDNAPVVRLKGIDDYIPDAPALDGVLKEQGVASRDQRNQIKQILAEIIVDEKGQVEELRDYDPPTKALTAAWDAAVEEVIRQNSPQSESTSEAESEAPAIEEKAPPVAEETPAEGSPLEAVRSKDFQTSGVYEVTTPSGVRRIFRDPESRVWLDADRQSEGFPNSPYPNEFLGDTKAEALARIAEDEDFSTPEKAEEKSPSEPAKEEAPQPKEKPAETPKPKATPAKVSNDTEEEDGERPIEVRHQYTEQRRAELGLPPREAEPVFAVQGSIDAADAEFARNPDAGRALVQELKEKMRPMTPTETATLNREQVTREKKVDDTTAALDKATEEDRMKLLGESDLAVKELAELMEVLEKSGSHSGASLGARAHMARTRDYSRAYLMATTQRDVNNGAPLSAKQRADIDTFVKELAEAQETIKRLEAEKAELEAQGKSRSGQVQKKLEKDIEKAQAKISTQVKREQLNAKLTLQAEAARARIRARGGNLNALINPLDVADYAIIAASYFRKGVLKISELTTKMVEAFGDSIKQHMGPIHEAAVKAYLEAANAVGNVKSPQDVVSAMTPGEMPSRRDVYSLAKAYIVEGLRGKAVLDAVTSDLQSVVPGIDRDAVATIFTDYGKTIYPSQEEIAVQLRKLRAAEQVALKLQDVLAGKAPLRTGYQRGDDDPEIRKLNKELNAAMRAAGITVTSPSQQLKSSLDAIKTRLRNEMEDRRLAIEKREPLPPGRDPVEYDDEAKALKAELDAVRKDYDDAFAKPGLTDKQRLQIAEKSLSRRIADEEKMLAAGILSAHRDATMGPWSPKLAALQTRLEALREQRAEARKAATPVKSEREQALDQQEKRLARLIAEEEKLVAEGKTARDTKPRSMPFWSPKLAAMQARLDTLREQRAAARAALKPSKDEAAAAIEKAEKGLQKSVDRMNDILKTGKLPGPSTDPKPWSPAIATLIKERGRLVEAVKALRKSLAPVPKTKAEKAADAAVKALDKSIAELNRRITTGDLSPAAPRVDLAGLDPRVQALRQQRKNLQETLDFLRKVTTPPKDPLQRKINQIRRATIKRSANLREKIRNKDFTVAPKPDRISTPALDRARLREFQLKRKFNEGRLEEILKNRTLGQKVWDTAKDLTFHLQRAIMTSIDVGGFGRQGGVAAITRPGVAKSVFTKNFAFTEKAADKAQMEMERDPAFKAAKDAKLALTEWRPGHKLSEMEEVYKSRIAKSIGFVRPITSRLRKRGIISKTPSEALRVAEDLGDVVAASERSYVTYLNAIRFSYFKALTAGVDPNDKATLKEIAKHINTFTGRGDLGKYENAAAALAGLFFSPKYWWSRLQIIGNTARLPFDVLTGFRTYRPEIRKARRLIAGEYARMLGGYTALYSLLGFASGAFGDDDDKPFKIGTESTSSDFGKVVFKNGTRVDFMSGLVQNIVFLSRLIQGKKTRVDGDVINLTGPDKGYKDSRGQLIIDFARSKAAPVPGAAANLLFEQDVAGRQTFAEKELAGLYMPISATETYAGFRELGVGGGTAAAISNAFGYGVSSYGEGIRDTDARQDLFTGLHYLSGGKFGYPPERYTKKSGGKAGGMPALPKMPKLPSLPRTR